MQISNIYKLFVVVVLFNIISCAQNDTSITINQLKHKINSDTSFVILDVRTPHELSGPLGHLSSIINIPLQKLQQRIHELDVYKNKEMAVICRTGHRSNIAANILRKNGFNAVSVAGGMTEYRKNEKN